MTSAVPSDPFERGLGRRLAANALHTASGRLATMALWLVFAPPILRAIGGERFAIWSLFYALTGYLGAFDFGLAQGTLRSVAAARGRGAASETGALATFAVLGYASLSVVWAAGVSLLSGPALAWLRIPPELTAPSRTAMVLATPVFLLAGLTNVTMAVMQGHGRFDLANATQLGTTLVQGVGVILVLGQNWGLEGLLFSAAVSSMAGAILGLLLLARGLPGFRWSAPGRARGGALEAIQFGGPMQVTNLMAVVNTQMDKVLLARFAGLVTVTWYELGSRIANAVLSLPQLLLLPVMAETASLSAAGRTERLLELYQRASRYYLTLAALCLAPLLAGAPYLCTAWIGGSETEATLALRWLALAGAVTLGTGLGTSIARGVGRTDLEAWFAVITVVSHLGASLLLLPRIGLRGALVASLVSHVVGCTAFMVIFARHMRWPLLAVALRPWFVPAVAVGLGWAAGAGLDRFLPDPKAGDAALTWVVFVAVSGAATLATLTVTVATRFFDWREARAIFATLARAAPSKDDT